MTRENKLALVVGFALILVVGILISDHFSAARSSRSAELGQGVIDPTRPNALAGGNLIEFDNGLTTPLTNNSHLGAQPSGDSFIRQGINAATRMYEGAVRTPPSQRETLADAILRDQSSSDSMNNNWSGAGIASRSGIVDPMITRELTSLDESLIPEFYSVEHEGQSITYHHVSPGESLSAISRKYYGDDSMVKQIALMNDITDLNQIKVGLRLRIPAGAPLLRASAHEQRLAAATTVRPTPVAPQSQAPADQPATTAVKTYTVKAGDTLGDISLKTLGTSRKWKKLYEFNADVIKDPNHVETGTILKIPPT